MSFVVLNIVITLISLATLTVAVEVIIEYKPDGTKICRKYCKKADSEEGCPEIECPPPTQLPLNKKCQKPTCHDEDTAHFLWPVDDDHTSFWQCPHVGTYDPIQFTCICSTFFDYDKQQCVHKFEWKKQCNSHPEKAVTVKC